MKCAKFGSYYHEDFLMPGIFPSSASSRKQIRQRLKSRRNPRGRPHLKQRRITRLLNFGFRSALTTIDLLAICIYVCSPKERLEAPASWPCGRRLRKLLRVALFFFQPVVKKQSPQRGSENIREMRSKVNNITPRPQCEPNIRMIYQENYLSPSERCFCFPHFVTTSDFRRY